MRRLYFIACVCGFIALFGNRINAQAVNRLPDAISWGTAFTNPTLAIVDAIRGPQTKCHLARLALSEAVGNGLTIGLKHLIVSPRPCVGCGVDGFPSGHTMNSTIGFSRDWRVGLSFTLGTAILRHEAHRHTSQQVLAGALVGIGAESIGRLVPCE